MLAEAWQILLFGKLQAHCGDLHVTRFRTQKAAGILAYLAYHLHRVHPRELLAELYWPDTSFESGRNSLKQELAALRRQLEPPGFPRGSVIIADRLEIRLNPASITTDTAAFEAEVSAGLALSEPGERARRLNKVIAIYQGELLPGHYEDWVLAERQRLADLYSDTLIRIAVDWESIGEFGRALDAAQRSANLDPLREERQSAVIRLYLAAGQPAEARRQYADFERLLRQELGDAPTAELQSLVRSIPESVRFASASATPPPSRVSARKLATTEPQQPTRHLPIPLTRFFGREKELACIPELLLGAGEYSREKVSISERGARLLTLMGPGGVGKTRLALEIAERVSPVLGGAVWFVQLANIADASALCSTILDSMGQPRSAQTDLLEALVSQLAAYPCLLVLDNFEHLVDDGAMFVARLLRRAPCLHCLVTSRRLLEIDGEQVYTLEPLSAPSAPGTPDRLMEFASVQLFVDRAQTVRPDFQITTRNTTAVAALSDRLEGIPLAIELAAAWSGTLTPAQILSRLTRRFDLLISRKRDVPERHRTLESAIDGSFRLLSKELQAVFLRLAIFRGGWSLEAAEQVVVDDPSFALQALTQLRERSLIQADEDGPEIRFRMLETLRDFAWEHLSALERLSMAQRHTAYFRVLVRQASGKLIGAEQSSWYRRLEQNIDNLRATLSWTLENDIASGLNLASDLWRFWLERCYVQEGTKWLEAVLSHPEAQAPTEARARALFAASHMASARGKYADAMVLMEANLQIAIAIDNKHGIAATLNSIGNLCKELGKFERSLEVLNQSLDVYSAISDQRGVAAVYNNLGVTAEEMGDDDEAERCYSAALAINHKVGNRIWEAQNLSNIGNVELNRGLYLDARSLHEQSLKIHQEIDNQHGVCDVLIYLADTALVQGDLDAARPLIEESLYIATKLDDWTRVAIAIVEMGDLLQTEGRLSAAAHRYGEGLRIAGEQDDLAMIARILGGIAEIAACVGQLHLAARMWGASESFYNCSRRSRPKDKAGDARRAAATAHSSARFNDDWQDGAALPLSHAKSEALEFVAEIQTESSISS